MSKIYDVAIIGSGLAGLTAAGILAHRGFSVLVAEKSRSIGGRAKVVRHDGFSLDHGIHYLRFAHHGKMSQALRAMKEKIDFYIPEEMLVWANGSLIPLPHRIKSFFTTPLLSNSLRPQVVNFMMSGGPFRLRVKKNASLGDLLDQVNADDETRNFVRWFAFPNFITTDLHEIAAAEAKAFAAMVMKIHFRGGKPAGYPKGGWHSFYRSVLRRIVTTGEVRCSTPVRGIIFKNGRAAGIETEAGPIHARSVIAAMHCRDLHRVMDLSLLGDELAAKCTNMIPTAGISFDLCLARPISTMTSIVATVDPPLLGAFPSNLEPSLAPAGKQLATFFAPLAPNLLRNRSVVKEHARKIREAIDQLFPGIYNLVEYERFLLLPIVDGALLKVGQTRGDRPAAAVPLPGLFFAGDWVSGDGAGSDIAFDSAMTAAKLVMKFLSR